MSEADSPNDQPASASIDSSEQPSAVHIAAADAVEPTDEEGWETVDFPGAMSIDALLHSEASPPMQLATFSEAIESGVIHYSNAELDPAIAHLTLVPSEVSDTDTQLQHLKEENAALRDRLTQAELDLVQHQIEWQLETACSQAETTGGAVEATPDRLHQLLQELERSQQTAQRQQILVETLTEQLESSQERIAQLERDCALTQQRHNEQVQQVLQAESACRDLRLRLHRQQQQTLQFKAALEKCLEMPTVYSQQPFPDASPEDSTTPPHLLAALLKPKNQPVKPWSQPAETTQTGDDQPTLPKPLFNLLNHGGSEQSNADLWQESDDLMPEAPFGGENQGHAIASSTDIPALLDSDDPQFVAHLIQLMFPEPAEGQSYPGTEALEADVSQAESIFDLSPFLGTERPLNTLSSVEDDNQMFASPEHSLDQQATLSSEDTAIAPSVPEDPSADLLWQDLTALIDPSSIAPSIDAAPVLEAASTPVAATQVPSSQVPSSRGGIPPLSTVPHPALPPTVTPLTASSDQSVQPINAWTWRDRLSSPNTSSLVQTAEQVSTEGTGADEPVPAKTDTGNIVIERTVQHPSKLLSLSTLDRRTAVKQTISVSSEPKAAPASFATATPSPIVYPLRSSKKLASLAAVDLPTFPKR